MKPDHILDIASLELIPFLRALGNFLDRGEEERSGSIGRYSAICLFEEPSTRTLLSFQQAGIRAGWHVHTLPFSSASIQKGETLEDTVRTLEHLGYHVLIIRTRMERLPHRLAEYVSSLYVINAGDGSHAHPTQALTDFFTLKEELGWKDPEKDVRKLRIGIVGDIRHARVAHSVLWLFGRLGAEVYLGGPAPWLEGIQTPPGARVHFCGTPEELLGSVDVVMVMRVQKERFQGEELQSLSLEEYIERWQIRGAMLETAGNPFLMHPGPVNPGVELEVGLHHHYPYSLVGKQVRMGVRVRTALFRWYSEESAG